MPYQAEPLQAFTCFTDLPLELQGKIWEATVDWRSHILPRPPITELAVCREARNVLLMIYRPCFQPHQRRDNFNWGVSTSPGVRKLNITGMGVNSPRSPYVNYETDVLHIFWSMTYGVDQRDVLRESISQEAIESIRNLVIFPSSWQPRYSSGPMRRVGDPPRSPNPDSKEVLTLFGSLQNLYFVNEPRVSISIPPGHQQRERALPRPRPGWNEDDEVLELAKAVLTSHYVEGKILVPVQEPIKVTYPSFNFKVVNEWIDRKTQELPDWNVPLLKYGEIITDPLICEHGDVQDAVDEAIRGAEPPRYYEPPPHAPALPNDAEHTSWA